MKQTNNPKAQVSELFNVIIGLIFIVIGILLFMYVLGQIDAAKEETIKDLQKFDLADSYLSTLSIMDKELYGSFLEQSRAINKEQKTIFFYGKVNSFETIERAMVKKNTAEFSLFKLDSVLKTSVVLIPKTTANVTEFLPSYAINFPNYDCDQVMPMLTGTFSDTYAIQKEMFCNYNRKFLEVTP